MNFYCDYLYKNKTENNTFRYLKNKNVNLSAVNREKMLSPGPLTQVTSAQVNQFNQYATGTFALKSLTIECIYRVKKHTFTAFSKTSPSAIKKTPKNIENKK